VVTADRRAARLLVTGVPRELDPLLHELVVDAPDEVAAHCSGRGDAGGAECDRDEQDERRDELEP
jgi:hypothetical protein